MLGSSSVRMNPWTGLYSIHEAAANGNFADVRRSLEEGVPVDVLDRAGRSGV